MLSSWIKKGQFRSLAVGESEALGWVHHTRHQAQIRPKISRPRESPSANQPDLSSPHNKTAVSQSQSSNSFLIYRPEGPKRNTKKTQWFIAGTRRKNNKTRLRNNWRRNSWNFKPKFIEFEVQANVPQNRTSDQAHEKLRRLSVWKECRKIWRIRTHFSRREENDKTIFFRQKRTVIRRFSSPGTVW